MAIPAAIPEDPAEVGQADHEPACTEAHRRPGVNAYLHGCRCPDTRTILRAKWRREAASRPRSLGIRVAKSDDCDEVAVLRAMAGDKLTVTVVERNQAVVRLTECGLSARQIALLLGCTARSVVRHRAAARIAPTAAERGEVAA